VPWPGLQHAATLLALLACAYPGEAAPADYAGRPVRAIEFSPADQPYARDYLAGILSVKTGRPLSLAEVRVSIERLYATGRYADVQVDAEASGDGVALRFITRNNWFIGRVTVSPVSAPPAEGVLANAARLELGALYTKEAGTQAVTNIGDVLRNNGFYATRVEPRYEYDAATQSVQIHFVVGAGPRAIYSPPGVAGNPERPVKSIVDATHWKGWFGWKDVTEARTQEGVQRVRRSYQKQDRLEARVALDKMEYAPDSNRVKPSLDVEGGPKVNISVVGAKISKGKLRQILPIYEEHSVDRDLLVEGGNNLVEYLEGDGYFDAKVDFEAKTPAADGQVIEYRIDRGERHRVTRISIEGNRYFSTETIRERMYVRPASFLQFRHGRYSDAMLQRDLGAITDLYRSNGFRDVSVTSSVERGSAAKETHMVVSIRIEEGPQWLVSSLAVDGVSDANRGVVEGLIQSSAGQPFSDLNVSVDRDSVLDYYYNNGYQQVAFQWSFTASGPHQVALKYTIAEGARYFVRDVLISGLGATNPALVRERVSLDPGAPVSRASVLGTQRRLYDLGIFARVDMALQNPEGQEQDKYMLLDVEEARRYTFTGGLGAEIAKIGGCSTCLDIPQGRAGFSPRAYFGVTRRNFLGDGHILSFQSRVSTIEQRAVLSYQAPQFRGNANVNLLFSGLINDSRDVNTFTAHRREASVQVGQKLSKASTMLYRFSYRRVTTENVLITPELIPFFAQPARIGMLSFNYIQDRRDDPVDSHRGIYNTVDFGVAARAFGSQTSFSHLLGHNATYHPFGIGSRFVLARSLTFGWLQQIGNHPIPLPELLFGGGASSHRGFAENQAGPRDPETGFPVGGSAILFNQVEFRFPLIGDNLRGVLFEDAGNVYSGLNTLSLRVAQHGLTDFNYMVHSVGFGVRYRTPVGPVRLDLGYGINPPRFFGFKGTQDQLLHGTGQQTNQRLSHFQFHFSLGQAF
jgi:outer membrane protein insertion porin family